MTRRGTTGRRRFLAACAAAAAAPFWAARGARALTSRRFRVTGFELLPVRATERTVWLFVRLRTAEGWTGLGEESDAFGFANTTKQDAARMEAELRRFVRLVEGKSTVDVDGYRRSGARLIARGDLVAATAYSAVEQALWDLAGKAADAPSYTLLGRKVRDTIPVYANINRATAPRTPAGFAAAAAAAVRDGFRAVKAAPFDGFPPPGSPAQAIDRAVDAGIAAVVAIREAVGPQVDVMVDCHSFFDVALAERVARTLEPQRLAWYEEPVAPERIDDTLAIKRRITQPMAAGELLFGEDGFAPLSHRRAVGVIMPDVKHCGGLRELTHIASMARADGVAVAPHNPSGPVSTAATIQVSAVIENFRLLEYQWGESAWRHEVVRPAETFAHGTIQVPSRPGLGVELNDEVVRAHLM